MDDQQTNWIADELARVASTQRPPDRLRLRVSALDAADVPVVGPPHLELAPARLTWGGRSLGILGGLSVALAILAAVVLVALPANPTVAQAARFGAQRPTMPPPLPSVRAPASYLRARVGALYFPNWTQSQGWRAYGGRNDGLVNQNVVTVYYRRGGRTLAYSIVTGGTLSGQRPGYVTFTQGGRTVVSWSEAGHSCLLSARAVSRSELLTLAYSVYVTHRVTKAETRIS